MFLTRRLGSSSLDLEYLQACVSREENARHAAQMQMAVVVCGFRGGRSCEDHWNSAAQASQTTAVTALGLEKSFLEQASPTKRMMRQVANSAIMDPKCFSAKL